MNNIDATALRQWMTYRDAEAFKEITSRHGAMVYATCKRVLGNAVDAEDVAQECFESLAQSRHLGRIGSLGAWLHGVATKRSLQHIRSEKRRTAREAQYSSGLSTSAEPSWDEIHHLVDEAILALPEELREPVVAHFLENRSHASIAAECGVSRQTVTSRIGQGIELVRAHLRQKGLPVAVGTLSAMLAADAAEAIPATLTAALGRVALAGVTGVGPGAAISLGFLGGAFVMKIVAIGVIAVAAVVSLFVMFRGEDTTRIVRATQSPSPGAARTTSAVRETSVTSAPAATVASRQVLPSLPVHATEVGVSGRVTSAEPVSGITVTVYSTEPAIRQLGPADVEGAFSFPGFAPDSEVYLFAEAEGFRSKLCGPVPLGAEGLSDYTISLVRTGGIQGTVVDVDGHPLPGVAVDASAPDELRPPSRTQCDGEARFEFRDVVPGGYYLRGVLPDQEDPDNPGQAVDVLSGEIRQDVVVMMDTGGNLSISGRVTDTEGNAVEGAVVDVFDHPRWHTRTDRDGNYRLSGLSNTKYGIEVNLAGYARHSQWDIPAGSEGVDFALPKAQATLSGRVVRADTGEPIPEFELQYVPFVVTDLYQVPAGSGEKHRDPDGRFEFKELPPGPSLQATLIARAAGYSPARECFSLDAGNPVADVVMRLLPEGAVTGIVVDESGSPLCGARVYVGSLETRDRDDPPDALSGTDGSFSLSGIAGDNLTVCAYHADYAPGSAQVSVLSGGAASVRLVLATGGVVEGVVTVVGQPLQSNMVFLPAPGGDIGGNTMGASTDSEGRFRIEKVPAGTRVVSTFYRYPAEATDEGHRIRRLDRTVIVQDGQTTRVDFDFSRQSAVLEGTVTCGGVPGNDGHARVSSSVNGVDEFRMERIRNGEFRFDDLPSGPVQIEVDPCFPDVRDIVRYKRVAVTLTESGPARLAVDFAQGARLVGRLTGVEGTDDVFVDVFEGPVELNVGSERPEAPLAWQGTPDAEGVFGARGFDPGTYTVVAYIHDVRATTQEERRKTFRIVNAVVELPENGTVEVDIPVR